MSQSSSEKILFMPTPERMGVEQSSNWESRLRTLQMRRHVKIDELDEIDREIENCERMLGRTAIESGLKG